VIHKEYRSVEFNLRIGCPVRCGYCPQDKVIKTGYKTKVTSYDTFVKVINNTVEGNHPIDVILSGHSEPMSVDHWFNLLSHANNHDFVKSVVMFSTGYKLTEFMINRLASISKLKVIWHLGDKDLMPGFDSTFLDKIHIVCKALPKSKFVCVGLEDNFDHIRRIVEGAGAELKFDKVINRAGNLEAVSNYDTKELIPLEVIKTKELITLGVIKKGRSAVTCRYVNNFKRPVVMPDGTALVCPNDYGSDLVIGNLERQTWSELDFNKVMELQAKDPDVICKRGCHQAISVGNHQLI
jgi:organic radical activating enzyme